MDNRLITYSHTKSIVQFLQGSTLLLLGGAGFGFAGNYYRIVEATAGIAPAYKGFADLCLTTWLRGHAVEYLMDDLMEVLSRSC